MAVETADQGQTSVAGQGGAAAAAPVTPAAAVPTAGVAGVPVPPASESGIYVYCVIEADGPQAFGKIGIGGRGDEVYTIHYKDLAAVVSRTALMVYDPTR